MRIVALIAFLGLLQLVQGQTVPYDSTLYLLLDTSRVKWNRPALVCGNGRAEMRCAYLLQDKADRQEFADLLRRTTKSARRFDRTSGWIHFRQKDRRWAQVERFMIDHGIGELDLGDNSLLVLQQMAPNADRYSYRIFGERQAYSLIPITKQKVTGLGSVDNHVPGDN